MQVLPHQHRRPAEPFLRAAVLALSALLACGAAFGKPDSDKHSERIGRFLADVALTPPATMAALATPSMTPVAPVSGANKPNIAERVRDGASDMVLTAMNFMGVPYKRGGNSEESGFDCSGFTRHIFELSLGLVLPRKADQQAHAPGLVPVGRDELKPGDLVFFNTLKRTFSHVGIYVGEGKFIHSPRAGGEVRVEAMDVAYWKKRFTGARRAEALAAAPPADAASTPANIR